MLGGAMCAPLQFRLMYQPEETPAVSFEKN